MLSKNKLSENKTMQLKLCNNKMPFSLPIIYVEQKQVMQKPKLCYQSLQQLNAIYASDYRF